MASASLQRLPVSSLAEADGQDFLTVRNEQGSDHQVFYRDVIAVLPILNEDGSASSEYALFSVSASKADQASSDSNDAPFSLEKYRLASLPGTLSKYALAGLPTHLTLPKLHPERAELSIVVSIKSGTCQAEAFFRGVVQPFLDAVGISEHDYKIFYTDSERWIADFAMNTVCPKSNNGIAQTILLLSGDGGVIDVINGLFHRPRSATYVKPTIGLLVLGTGNALANSSGLNAGSTKGLRTILKGVPRSIPTFVCKCSPGSVLLVDEARSTEALPTDEAGNGIVHGAVVTSWCLHAALVADSDTTEYRKFGSQRFAMAAKELLTPSDGSPPHKWQGKITTSHKTETGELQTKTWSRSEHMYVLATLVSNLEAALKISPHSKPLDGQLRLIDFPPLSDAEVMNIFGMAYQGGLHVDHADIGYQPIDALRIDFDEADARWRRICVDGKIVLVPEHGWIEMQTEKQDIVDLIVDEQS